MLDNEFGFVWMDENNWDEIVLINYFVYLELIV